MQPEDVPWYGAKEIHLMIFCINQYKTAQNVQVSGNSSRICDQVNRFQYTVNIKKYQVPRCRDNLFKHPNLFI
jgi:hypothetical protein